MSFNNAGYGFAGPFSGAAADIQLGMKST